MKKILVLAACASLITSSIAIAGEGDPQTPKEAIDQAQAAQASSHSWMWYAAGAVVAAVAIGLKSKHGSDNNASATPGGCDSGIGAENVVPPSGACVAGNPVGP